MVEFDVMMTAGNSTQPITSSPLLDVIDDVVVTLQPADEPVTSQRKTRKKRKSSRKSEEAGETVVDEQVVEGLLFVLLCLPSFCRPDSFPTHHCCLLLVASALKTRSDAVEREL